MKRTKASVSQLFVANEGIQQTVVPLQPLNFLPALKRRHVPKLRNLEATASPAPPLRGNHSVSEAVSWLAVPKCEH